MSASNEGYVYHVYGAERYLHHVVASVHTLRRHDAVRPVALYCPEDHIAILQQRGFDQLFDQLHILPKEHWSIVGFKLHIDQFKPYPRSLYVDADMIWCRNPDPLWQQLGAYTFTATGLERADFYFGGPKGFGVLWEAFRDRRRATITRFNLTHLPRVQAGVIYAGDARATANVCRQARQFLKQAHLTHFRSRLAEGRSEESCEWAMAMAMAHHEMPVLPWFQGYNSPQLDYIDGMVQHDDAFETVVCTYWSDPAIRALRGLPNARWRDRLIRFFSKLPGKGDFLRVTPFTIHFGWAHQKAPYYAFAERVWTTLTSMSEQSE